MCNSRIITPGPDTAITIRNTLFGGHAVGVVTTWASPSVQTIWAVAASAGIVTLLIGSGPLFLAVKSVGAVYLLYLGIQSLWQSLRPSVAVPDGGQRRQR